MHWEWPRTVTASHHLAPRHTQRCAAHMFTLKCILRSQCMARCLCTDMSLLFAQSKGHARASTSLNTATPRMAQQAQESKLTCFPHFLCCYACVVCAERECGLDCALPKCAVCARAGALEKGRALHMDMFMWEEA